MEWGALRMKKFTAYKVWLIFSTVAVLAAIVLTVLFQLSTPKDCPACGMAAVGLVPFWLLAFLALVVNTIVIPINVKKHSLEFTHNLKLLSWLILVPSVVAILALILLMVLNF